MSGGVRRAFKRRATALAAGLVRPRRLTPAGLRELDPRSVLIVRQHNQMGDMICATVALRAIRQAYPRAEITLVTAPVNSAVVRHNPDLDRVEMFDQRMWRRPWRLLAFLGRLRRPRPDLAFVLSTISFSLTSAAIAVASGARHVVGADSRPFGWDVSRRAFSLEMRAIPVMDRHAVLHGLAPLQELGIDTPNLDTVVVPAPEERERAAEILAELGLEPGFWALHPGAGKGQNVWPAERFAEAAERAAAAGHCVLVLHGPADGPVVAAFRARLGPAAAEMVRIAPACSVGTAAALLERADRFLCNDTGIMHVAGALRVPTLALFGPTDPEFWKPLAQEVVALRSPGRRPDPRGREYGWMEGLEVDRVWRSWSDLEI